ncbi:uncharacterized protein LOC114303723 [Camellia sinensis]|uniref:uncharacterized protein LOC114303723 n=1 Tax=Camellia sinensis TaxID=4442 RepID=UPI001036F2F5|nr:uncharacterized protein LOC114303723 [Camellia sinensis]
MESVNVVIDDTGSPTSAINEEENGESPILDIELQSKREAEVQAQEGTKWIFKNKSEENGIVARNKARLVAQGYTQVEAVNYDEMSMIGSLLYLTTSRPDIDFSVGVCAHYQACLKESHLLAVKHIIKYVNGTLGYGIWFSTDTTAEITSLSDVDWAGCADDRKSTSGGCLPWE